MNIKYFTANFNAHNGLPLTFLYKPIFYNFLTFVATMEYFRFRSVQVRYRPHTATQRVPTHSTTGRFSASWHHFYDPDAPQQCSIYHLASLIDCTRQLTVHSLHLHLTPPPPYLRRGKSKYWPLAAWCLHVHPTGFISKESTKAASWVCVGYSLQCRVSVLIPRCWEKTPYELSDVAKFPP